MKKLFKVALIVLMSVFAFNVNSQIYSKAQLDWVLENSVNQYGVSMYLDVTTVESSRQVVLVADTWTDISMTFIYPQMSGFSFDGTEITVTKDFDGRIALMPINVNGYTSANASTIYANIYVNDVACGCGGGTRYFRFDDSHGFFSFIAYKDDLTVGDKLNFRIKSDKAQTFTIEALQFVIEIK